MYGLLNIPDDLFTQAAKLVADAVDLNSGGVEAILRSYVDLGSQKKISDFDVATVSDRYTIANSVLSNADSIYTLTWSTNDVMNVLNQLVLSGGQGLIDQRIVDPHKWELQQEQGKSVAESSSTGGPADTSMTKSITDVFGGIGTGIQSALKGLGINLPLDVIIIIVGVVILFVVLQSFKMSRVS